MAKNKKTQPETSAEAEAAGHAASYQAVFQTGSDGLRALARDLRARRDSFPIPSVATRARQARARSGAAKR